MNTVNCKRMLPVLVLAALASSSIVTPAYAAFEPLQSPRLERAKDYIADEQW